MSKIQILDCTLRDGGYCNEWDFGERGIKQVVDGLVSANIEIIECGFLSHKISYKTGISKFSTMQQARQFIPDDRTGKKFVLMVNYGELDVDKLECRSDDTVDGIRIAFHKKDVENAILLCKKIKQKGYDVFVQPMVSLGYSDEEFLDVIKKANLIDPYAFYIVDSFGVMKKNDLIRLFYIVEHNLNKNIRIGYHSHNNLQLAYSNAQSLVAIHTNRELIIDSSIMGMGRGAGNLNTELFTEYLNETFASNYSLTPILKLIDNIIVKFHQENYWGYSLPNYLSAKHNIHPNYAKHLSDKNTLTIEEMDAIFDRIDVKKSVNFDKQYIESLYLEYMNKDCLNGVSIQQFANDIKGKKILLIAPGKSSETQKDEIFNFMKQPNVVSISVNFNYYNKIDYLFVSNIRRYQSIGNVVDDKTILTSNVSADKCYLKVNYSDLINTVDKVNDNAGLMAIKMMINLGVKEIYLAGFDGYSYLSEQNYAKNEMKLIYKKEDIDALNSGMTEVLGEYKNIGIKDIMVNDCLISVIIPVKNGEKYLKECIDSLICQSYKNLDIIIIDDGSTDATYTICENYAKLDCRITVVHNEHTKGVSYSRNIGVNLAKGEWISFIDGDDWVESGLYSKIAINDLDNVDAVFWRFTKDYLDGKIKKFNETTVSLLAKEPFKIQYTLKQTFIIENQGEILTDYVFSGVWRILLKKQIIIDNSLKFNENLRYAEDKLFLVEYLSLCSNGFLIDEYLYHYRQNVIQSATSTIINETYSAQWLNTFLPSIERAICNNKRISNEIKRDLIFYMKDTFVFRAIMSNKKSAYRSLVKDKYVKSIINLWNKEVLIKSGLSKRDIRQRMSIKYKYLWIIRFLQFMKKKLKSMF